MGQNLLAETGTSAGDVNDGTDVPAQCREAEERARRVEDVCRACVWSVGTRDLFSHFVCA